MSVDVAPLTDRTIAQPPERAHPRRRLTASRNQRLALACVLLILILNAAFVVTAVAVGRWLDPYGFHQMPWEGPTVRNSARVSLASYSYVAKAADIIRVKPGHILLGSSVADNGFRLPGSAARRYDPTPEKMAAILRTIDSDSPYLNAAVRGGGIFETKQFLEHAYRNNPGLAHVILGIEWSLFTHAGTPRIPRLDLIGKTYISPKAYFEYTITNDALAKAYDVLAADTSPENRNVHEFAIAAARYWNALATAFRTLSVFPSGSSHAATPKTPGRVALTPGAPSAKLIVGPTYLDIYRFTFTVWFVDAFKKRYDRGGSSAVLLPGPFQELKKFVDLCQAKGIPHDIFLSPQHPLFWAMMRRAKLESLVELWMKEVSAITPAWDFSELVDFDNPDAAFTSDTLHTDAAAGVFMMPFLRKSGRLSSDRMWRVDRDNVAALAQRRRDLLTDWLNRNVEVANTIEALPVERIGATTLPGNWFDLLPTPYNAPYKGYNIIRFLNLFYALPTSFAPPHDLYKVVQAKYPGMISAETLEQILGKIDRTVTQ